MSMCCFQHVGTLCLYGNNAMQRESIGFTDGAPTQSKDTVVNNAIRLDGVEVKASRNSKELSSSVPVRSFDRNKIAKLGITDFTDAVNRMPGVVVRDYGGAGGMKTVSVRGFGAQYTGVSYDGIMLSECQNASIDIARYSLNDVSSISLTLGDGNDIFVPAKNSSSASLLEIQTMDRKEGMTALLKLGSFGYVNPFLSYKKRISDKLFLSVSAEYTYSENDYPFTLENGEIKTRERRTNSQMNSAHGEINLFWNISKYSDVQGKVYYYDNNRELPGIVRYYTDLSDENLHDKNFFSQLKYNIFHADKISVKWLGKFNWASSEYRNGLYKDGSLDATYWQREAYSSLCVLYNPCRNVSFDYSIDYSYNNLNSSKETDQKPYRNTILQSITAKYQSDRFTAIARLLHSKYINNVRVADAEPAKNIHRFSPSISISYRLLKEMPWYVRASYKNIFRSPTFNELYFYHYGSTDLLPESTNQINVGFAMSNGVKTESEINYSFTLDAYINNVSNKILAVPYNMFVWRNINVEKVHGKGIEASLNLEKDLNKKHAINLNASYTFQRIMNASNEHSQYYKYQIAYTPKQFGSVSLGWNNPWINVVTHVIASSNRWTNNEHYDGTCIDGYVECGISFMRSFTIDRSSIDARLDIKNIFDKQYCIVAKYPMPGRAFMLSVAYKY